MKTRYLLLILATLALTAATSHAASTDLPRLTVNGNISSTSTLPTLSGRGSDFAIGLHQSSSQVSFAELSHTNSIPLPSPWMLMTALAVGVVVFRVYSLNHARAMADHERDMHRAKALMYESLQDN